MLSLTGLAVAARVMARAREWTLLAGLAVAQPPVAACGVSHWRSLVPAQAAVPLAVSGARARLAV